MLDELSPRNPQNKSDHHAKFKAHIRVWFVFCGVLVASSSSRIEIVRDAYVRVSKVRDECVRPQQALGLCVRKEEAGN